MAKDLYPEIIDSVGIEVEFSNFDRENPNVKRLVDKNLPGYKRVHDASCETPIVTFANTGLRIEFEDDNDFQQLQQVCAPALIGGEIVSPIRNSNGPEWIKEITKLCELLWDLGEDENSNRDSLHIHVNVSQDIPFFVIKNLLRLTANFEAILFRLGGMGRINRGIENAYCYMRPFLGNGIPIIKQTWKDKRMIIPIMDYDDLMGAESREDFFDKYGDSRHSAGNRARYVAQRYMCVNFFPILTQGSFEFRTANKTLKPEYIIAWTNFCKAMVEKAYSSRDESSFENIARPLYKNVEISEQEFLHALSYLSALDEDTINVLTEIWNLSPTPMFDNIRRLTHLENYPTYTGAYSNYIPKQLEKEDKVESSIFVDVHQLNNERNRWNMPPNINMPNINDFRIRNPPLVSVNADGDTYPLIEVPMNVIRHDWWVEYNSEDALLAIKRSDNHNNIFIVRLSFMDIDDEGNEREEQYEGQIPDNNSWFDLIYMMEQWWEDRTHPDDMIPHLEE